MTELSYGALRARRVIDEHQTVSSTLVADKLSVSRNYALRSLRELVRAGIVDARLVGGGCYEWSRR